jgi:hypothetical protein
MRFEILDQEEPNVENKLDSQSSYQENPNSRFEIIDNSEEQEQKDFYKKIRQNIKPYTPLKEEGFSKGLLKGATANFSESIPGLEDYSKIKEGEELGAMHGEFIGAALPIGGVFKALKKPFQVLEGLTNFGKLGKAGINIAKQATVGAAYGGLKQGAEVAKGNEFDTEKVAEEAMTFGLFGSLFEAVPAAYQWAKSLNPKQKSEMFVKNIIPEDLSPSQYKFYESEVVPELQKVAQTEYQSALETATNENNLKYHQELSNVKAKHEADLFDMKSNRQISPDEYAQKQKEYQNQVKKIQQDHQRNTSEIEKSNQEALQSFEEQKKDFELMKSRQRAVQNAIQPENESSINLKGSVEKNGKDIGIRPNAPFESKNNLEQNIGKLISDKKIENSTIAGKNNIEAVKANDAIDYKNVNDAYKTSELLNEQVTETQPTLAQQLKNNIIELESIPKLSPPQEQKLSFAKKTLEAIADVDPNGMIIGLKPINNRILQEQAKAIRYTMDFNFEHGNTRGIFTPLVNSIEAAVENGANLAGNEAAIQAHKTAKSLYADWANTYDNPYIRPYRDTRNFDYSKTFNSSLNIDEFNQLNKVLSKSNAGQQLAKETKRSLVEKYLERFTNNPKKSNPYEFNKVIDELKSVLDPEEIYKIRQEFNQARKTDVIIGKKVPVDQFKEPIPPKIQKKPSLILPKSEVPTISKVNIPTKKPISPTSSMKLAAQKMNIKPEQALKLTESRSGIKELRKDLSPTVFEKVGKDKMKQILYEGNVKRTYKGTELQKILNKTENYEIFSEFLGEKETADLLKAAEAIGEESVTGEKIQKMIKRTGAFTALLKYGILI